ncbi:hypothetical protein Ctob_016165 [Chrysochromulina tobinii]|uniref:Uncharacterized protein n=1 Tax=Chrysochromulina tobinii TaxID=1460289 RepID=A0A0M0LQI3_9EUKA|nr:hypothetical protein Ctob_016165 [Chrysochromulina tobinii]|eukprot:KOO53304.1 hypothetical protein Ctob_016165 [Chrysochromulina sp. CCMP291]
MRCMSSGRELAWWRRLQMDQRPCITLLINAQVRWLRRYAASLSGTSWPSAQRAGAVFAWRHSRAGRCSDSHSSVGWLPYCLPLASPHTRPYVAVALSRAPFCLAMQGPASRGWPSAGRIPSIACLFQFAAWTRDSRVRGRSVGSCHLHAVACGVSFTLASKLQGARMGTPCRLLSIGIPSQHAG